MALGPTPPGAPAPASPLAAPPANVGGASVNQGNPGNAAAALVDVQNAVKMLQDALPKIPMGSKLHTKLLNALKSISEELQAGSENPQLQQQSLTNQLKQNQQQAPLAALSRLAPAASPAMPPPSPAA